MGRTVTRRSFLGGTAGIAAGVVAVGRSAATPVTAATALAPVQPSVARIGLQLYTVGDQVSQDIERTLENVAKVGYKFVEFAGYGNRTPEQVRAALDRLKLTAPSTHIGMAPLRSELDGQIHIAQTIGHEYITVPSLGNEMPAPADGWKKIADEFNAIAAKLKARKIGLAFHSHRDEFLNVGGGKKGMDVFISNTDPNLVVFQMDLGWARVAGQDPGFVTVTSTLPASWAGAVTSSDVQDVLVTTAGTPPNVTVAPGPNPTPAIVTPVPPSDDPVSGETAPSTGGGPRTTVRPKSWVAAGSTPFDAVTVNE